MWKLLKQKHSWRMVFLAVGIGGFLLFPSAGNAQETDILQHPNVEQAGIKKSRAEQIGTGRGNILTLGSSLYIIARDPFRSIRPGRI